LLFDHKHPFRSMDSIYDPEPSFLEWKGNDVLTDDHREEILWTAK
jgi:hypothetical protein